MATGTSFKQQCPSCEAMVPIRDPGLIGRKIDCPKCKYRFVVEAPPRDDDDEEEARPARKAKAGDGKMTDKPAKGAGGKTTDKPAKGGLKSGKGRDDDRPSPKKKKQGGSQTVILGVVLGVLALGVLGAGGYFLFGGSSKKDAGKGNQTASNTNTNTGNEGEGEGEKEKEKTPAAGEKEATHANITNLLPNDTRMVIDYPMPRTLGSSLKTVAIGIKGGFQAERFQAQFGFGLDDLQRVTTARESHEKDRGWVFTVVQTKRPYQKEAVLKGLRLQKQTQPVMSKTGSNKQHEVYLVKAELGGVGNLLLKANQPRDDFAAYFKDDTTLVFADRPVLQSWLEQDGKPEHRTREDDTPRTKQPKQPPSTDGEGGRPGGKLGGKLGGSPRPGDDAAGAGAGGGGGNTIPLRGGPSAAGGPGGPTPAGPTPGGPGETPATNQPAPAPEVPQSWLTIDPSLKNVLDRVEKFKTVGGKKELVSVLTVAMNVQPLTPLFRQEFDRHFDPETFPTPLRPTILNIRSAIGNARMAAASLTEFDTRTASGNVAIEFAGHRDAETAERLFKTAFTPLLVPAFRNALDLTVGEGQTAPTDPGAGTGGEGGDTVGGGPVYPGTGGRPGGGRFPGGPTIPGRPGAGGSPRPGGPGPGDPDAPAGGGTGGTGGTVDEKKDGTIAVSRDDKTLTFTTELTLSDTARDRLEASVQEQMLVLRGQAVLAGGRLRVHDLAEALKKYADGKGEFPQAALPRDAGDRGIAWRPDQRLSWVAALLPFFGQEYADWPLDLKAGWNEGENLNVARSVVPALLGNRLPGMSPALIRYPSQPDTVLATSHFVGVTGLGLDAAEFARGDDAMAKKLGVFGYERVTKKADVTDGLDKTIALIMVPGTHAPWLAGGGATVRGVSDDPGDNPLAPFVCLVYPGTDKRFEGKRGTLAVMADGKVRFLPADLPAATFRALCTIAGGEPIDKLNDLCPLFDDPGGRELRTDGPTTPPVTGDQARLQGMWMPVSVEANGLRIPADGLKAARLVFSGNTLTMKMGPNSERSTFVLDATKTPKTIDLTPTDGPNSGKTQLGIYELTDKQLKVCSPLPGGTSRPTTFAAPVGSKLQLVVLERTTTAAPTTVPVRWRDYTPASKAFTVKMPGEVAAQEQEVPLPTGDRVKVKSHISITGSGATCAVLQNEFPAGFVEKAGAATILAGGKQGVVATMPRGSKITAEKGVKLGAHQGQEWTVAVPGGGAVTIRFFLVGDQGIQLTAGPTPAMSAADVRTFLDSFRLAGR